MNNRSLTHAGITFHSQLEIEHYKKLMKMSKRKNLTISYEADKIPYTLVSHHNYNTDFTIVFPDGHRRYIEIKGYLRPKDRTKMKAVLDQHPLKDVRIVFAKDNKLNSKSKTRYSTWAKKLGIPYSVGKIPNGWLERNG